ncbi:MAG: hypothetical protein LBR07_08750 [Puniceicoccales bacterium]|jgi:hypothetical protein|nr:hypothetical protein [Puniceicoccales bacterium]
MGYLSWSVQRYGTDWNGRKVGLSHISGSGFLFPEEYTTECYEELKEDFYSLRKKVWANTDSSGTQGKGCFFVRYEEMEALLRRHFCFHEVDENPKQMKFPFYIYLYEGPKQLRFPFYIDLYGHLDEDDRAEPIRSEGGKPILIIENDKEWTWNISDFLLPAPDVDDENNENGDSEPDYYSLDYDEEFNSWGQAEEEVDANISDIIYCVQNGLDWVEEWDQHLN